MSGTTEAQISTYVGQTVSQARSGEQVLRPDGRAVPDAVARPAVDPVRQGPIVPAIAPLATLAEVDAAIAKRRKAIADCQERDADLTRRLAAPKASRIKALLAGKGADDHADLMATRDTIRDRCLVLEAELSELTAARDPFLAAADHYQYDTVIRPKLRQALATLARHLDAAAAVYREHADTIRDADRLHGGGVVRGILSEKRGDGDLPAPDDRELRLVQAWRRVLQADAPNHCRLQAWHAEITAAGIDLGAIGAK